MKYEKYKNVSDPLDGTVFAEVTVQGTVLGGKRFTFRLLRDVPSGEGAIKQTNFMLPQHIESIERVLAEVRKEIALAEESSRSAQKTFLEEKRKRDKTNG